MIAGKAIKGVLDRLMLAGTALAACVHLAKQAAEAFVETRKARMDCAIPAGIDALG